MNKLLLLLLLLSICTTDVLYGQVNIDSLVLQLQHVSGADRIDVLSALMGVYERSDPAKSISYGQEAILLLREYPDVEREIDVLSVKSRAHLSRSENDSAMVYAELTEKLAREAGSAKGLAEAANQKGIIMARQGNFDQALEHFINTLNMREQLEDERGKGNALNNIGIVHMRLGNYDESLDYYLRALDTWEKVGDKTGIARVLNNTGNVHRDLGSYDEALGFYLRGLEIREQMGDSVGVAYLLNNIGIVNSDMDNDDIALGFYLRALAIWDKVDDQNNIGRVLDNIGTTYRKQGNLTEALSFGERALLIKEEIGDKRGEALALNSIAMVHQDLGNTSQALNFFQRSLALAEEIGEQRLSREIYASISGIYEAQGDYKSALEAYQLYKAAHDSLFNAESQSVIAELQTRYQTNEQRQEIELLQQKQQIQNLWLFGLVGGLVLIAVIAFLTYNRYRLKHRAHALLTKTYEELQHTYHQLETTQQQLIHTEKMASLGQMMAGIAHEIKNPLNFVNNFSTLNVEMIDELMPWIEKHGGLEDRGVQELIENMKLNATKINNHGLRADSIVRSMLEHSQTGPNERRLIDINTLVANQINWAFNSKLAQIPDLKVDIKRNLGRDTGEAEVVPQEISRALLNLLGNAIDAVQAKNAVSNDAYTPTVVVSTQRVDGNVEIRVTDNGPGVSREIQGKIFEPFFTTKPTGSGTGLGLSLSYDIIVKGHSGSLTVESKAGEGATFVIMLPRFTSHIQQT